MPLDGTLNTLSLPNLIQLHCSQQQSALVRLVRAGREGVLAFAEGELVHASVGALTGEEAVYELLSWEDGKFHVGDVDVALPPANVQTPWGMLVLDALRQIDEERAARNAAGETFLRQAKDKGEFARAVIVGKTGQLRAAVTEGAPEPAAALATFLASRVEQLAQTLALGSFEHLICNRAGDKICVGRIEEGYVACWMGERASLEPFHTTVLKFRQKDRG